jgi:2-methylcitrate dehydratase PrpD
VHPLSLQAAAVGPEPADGLQAKFSIPYLIAYTVLHGPPAIASFEGVDGQAARRATAIEVRTDRGLLESEAVLLDGAGGELARVKAALGSPERPLDEAGLERKVRELSGDRLAGALDDPERPAAEVLALAGLPA